MSKIVNIFWREPVVTLSCTTGAAAVLAQQNLIPAWVPLVVLAVTTPLERYLVTPIKAKVSGGANAS